MSELDSARRPAKMHVGPDAFYGGLLFIQVAVVPLSVNVIADEPTHAGAENDVRCEVLAHRESGCADCGGQAIRHDGHNQRSRIFMRYNRGQGPGADGMAGRKSGVPERAFLAPETAVAIAFERPFAASRQ